MKVSVVIPVYNAGQYLDKAVKSVLIQKEAEEILLIEDGSTDNSYSICKQLELQYPKVKVFTHPGHGNLGAGVSRNLGIENATNEYIAFLDADDYYLPGRFRAEAAIFAEYPQTAGVYGATGTHVYDESAKQQFQDISLHGLTTIKEPVPPGSLHLVLAGLHPSAKGHFHLDALTVKKRELDEKNIRFPDIRLHQDSFFSIQLAHQCQLMPGITNEAIAVRGIHNANRIVRRNLQSKRVLWEKLHQWAKYAVKDRDTAILYKNSMLKDEIMQAGRIKGLFLLLYHSLFSGFFNKKNQFFDTAYFKITNGRYRFITSLRKKII